MTRPLSLAALALAAGLGLAAQAAGAEVVGDAARGREKIANCTGCHGIDGFRTAFPEVYNVPRIGGQHPAYLAKALQAYKTGERPHPSMRAIAASLSDQDMADLAAYYGARPTKTAGK